MKKLEAGDWISFKGQDGTLTIDVVAYAKVNGAITYKHGFISMEYIYEIRK